MKSIIYPLFIALLAVLPATGQDAERIMEQTRLGATLQGTDLEGKIRKGRGQVPVHLFLRGENIQFQYSPDNKNWKIFHMRLADDHDLFEMVNGKTFRFPNEKLGIPIAGSDLTFEDLSLRFFYWPNPVLKGSERVKTFDCWKIRLNNPGNSGKYAAMYVWVHKDSGAFIKVEGFDRQGNKLKQFTVEDIMKLPDGSHTLKKMKVSSYSGGRASGVSYLEFDMPKKATPGGLR